MSEVLQRFGRYFLLDRLAQGGMAEIYRARLAAADGAGRIIVIKRIQAGYGENKEFLQMFKSEIKVTMMFNHPNIVQLFDFGEEQQQPYIAMEFVDGKNARQFLNQYAEVKQFFPVELAVYIAAQTAAGLHYAHSFRDKISGEALNIVHRDISPQNILVSYEGNVKVIDFGIAKATTNVESTRAGIIKGKPSYLSPEQISGDPLDGRSDIFALGAVLWELLTGKKLFAGESDLAILKLIESSQTYVKAPSTINPKVPKELDIIVFKALAKKKEQRYQTADELYRALHRFLYSFTPEFNPSDLGLTGKSLFKKEIIDDRKRIQALNEKAERLLRTELPKKRDESEDETASLVSTHRNRDISHRIEVELSSEEQKSKLEIEPNKAPPSPPQATGTGTKAPHASPGHARQTSSSIRQTAPSPTVSSNQNITRMVLIGLAALGVFIYIAPSLGIKLPGSSLNTTGKSKLFNSSVRSITANDKSIKLNLNVFPKCANGKIKLNDDNVDPENPSIPVLLDAPLELSVECDGYKSIYMDFVVNSKDKGGLKETSVDVALEPLHFGYLSIHTTPSAEATINLGSSIWKRRTPVENEKIPAGTYTLSLSNDILGMGKSKTITIEENKSINIDERLEINQP